MIKNYQIVRDLFHEFEQELLFPTSSSICKFYYRRIQSIYYIKLINFIF